MDRTTNSNQSTADTSPSLLQNQNEKAVFLANGLLDVSHMSEHITNIVNRNATNSRLLQLPAELRNCIWKYALQYEYVQLCLPGTSPELCGYAYTYVDPARRPETKQVSSAFYLPEVCRQIYSETATLAYHLNTFTIAEPISLSEADLFRISAHKVAIRTIRLYDCDLVSLVHVIKSEKATCFDGILGLRRIEVIQTSIYESPMHRRLQRRSRLVQIKNEILEITGGESLEIVWV